MKLFALVFIFAAVYAKHEEYIGWKSYFVGPKTQDQLLAVAALIHDFELDFLGKPTVDNEGLVLVKPEHQTSFTNTLDVIGVSYRIHADDVVEALRKDDEAIEERTRETMARNGGARIPYDNYQPLSVYEEYLEDIARRFPDRTTLVSPANSFQGRPIKVLKISTTNFEDTRKPIIFIDATIHAREWIAPPTVAWAIHKLLEDVTEPDLLERFDWILIPVANPDGYEYSHTTNRWWRKNRSTDSSTGSTCFGVDGNRNYDFFWNTVGVSSNPCAEDFPGSRAFSEVETRVIRDLLKENLNRIALYLTMHSFGSMILYPWGHDGSLPDNAFALHVVGVAMADAIEELRLPHFRRYVVGNPVHVLGYAASGASEDYAHSIGIPLSYTYELPGFGWGLQGFNLNPRYIEQVCRETWAAIAIGARRAGDLFQS